MVLLLTLFITIARTQNSRDLSRQGSVTVFKTNHSKFFQTVCLSQSNIEGYHRNRGLPWSIIFCYRMTSTYLQGGRRLRVCPLARILLFCECCGPILPIWQLLTSIQSLLDSSGHHFLLTPRHYIVSRLPEQVRVHGMMR